VSFRADAMAYWREVSIEMREVDVSMECNVADYLRLMLIEFRRSGVAVYDIEKLCGT